jgi:hypothetical protein
MELRFRALLSVLRSQYNDLEATHLSARTLGEKEILARGAARRWAWPEHATKTEAPHGGASISSSWLVGAALSSASLGGSGLRESPCCQLI